jgi:putative SOS response-associated peptidase YedK
MQVSSRKAVNMCGRFILTLDPIELREAFDLGEFPPEWTPRYNIAPSQPIAVVHDLETRNVDFMRWGLVPSWAKDISIGNRMINARAETIAEKPSFRSAFTRRRCLILADGFYEWTKPDKAAGTLAIPHLFRLKDGSPFAMAGLWEIWESPEGDVLKTCTIVTTNANEVVAPIHERMPVVFDPAISWEWLQNRSQEDLVGMLQPFPSQGMVAHPVSRAVNDPKVDNPSVIKAVKL